MLQMFEYLKYLNILKILNILNIWNMSSLSVVKVVASSDEVERGEELLEESSEGQRLRWIQIQNSKLKIKILNWKTKVKTENQISKLKILSQNWKSKF